MALVHERIKELRLKWGMTLAKVADTLGVTEATAQRYETGKGIKSVPYEVVEKYANLFHCSPAYLLGWDDADAVASSHEDSLQDLGSVDKAINDELLAFAESWMQEVGEIHFNDEEYKQITNYAKFVLNQRN